MTIGPTVGQNVAKVSWRVNRSRWSDWHYVESKRADKIVTRCGIPVPPAQNFGRSETWDAMPLEETCQRCLPPVEQADGSAA